MRDVSRGTSGSEAGQSRGGTGPLRVRRASWTWASIAVLALLVSLAAACDGGGKPTPVASPTTSVASCEALAALKTYRYAVALKLEVTPSATSTEPEAQATPLTPGGNVFEYGIDASFVAPDSVEAVITGGSSPFSMIVIGDTTWIELASTWKETVRQQYDVPYRPPTLCAGVLPDLDLSQVSPVEEQLNGVDTLRYEFMQAYSEKGMARIFGGSSDMDRYLKYLDVQLWLPKKGAWPVRMVVDAKGSYPDGRELKLHLTLDVKDANSDDIKVGPPI